MGCGPLSASGTGRDGSGVGAGVGGSVGRGAAAAGVAVGGTRVAVAVGVDVGQRSGCWAHSFARSAVAWAGVRCAQTTGADNPSATSATARPAKNVTRSC